MSVWKRKAIAANFPDVPRHYLQNYTIYGLFSELLHLLPSLHQENNNQVLIQIYEFGEWCLRQKEGHLSNAAAVSFYEHLFDHPIDGDCFYSVPYLTPFVIHQCLPLWEWWLRRHPEKYESLKIHLKRHLKKSYALHKLPL